MFDSVVIVDWSARAKPSSARPTKDAIWIGVCGAGHQASTYHRTRMAAEQAVMALLADEAALGRRVLMGFDFPMGYPAGFARAVTGRDDVRRVWAWLAGQVRDDERNGTNRLAVGGALNAVFAPAKGPFWGRPKGQQVAHLPFKKDVDYAAIGLHERRAVERLVPGAKSVFQLMGRGSVGSQALTGLPMIHRLAQRPGVAVWPFDGDLSKPVVLAEVYPSLLATAVRADPAPIKDEAQVRLLARALWVLGQRGQLAPLFDVPAIAREEGWILGAGHGQLLEQALSWS